MSHAPSLAEVILTLLGFALSVAVLLAVLRLFQISNDVRAIRQLLASVEKPARVLIENDQASCPKCGKPRDPNDTECRSCGVLFARFKGARR